MLLDLCSRVELVEAVEKARKSKRWLDRERAREEEEQQKAAEDTVEPMLLRSLAEQQAEPSE